MKGLLLKDLLTLVKQCRIYLIMIVVLTLVPELSLSNFSIVYAAMLPITALAYDERSKWDYLAIMMPYKTKSIVFSKYLIGYLMIVVTAILSALARFGVSVVKRVPFDMEFLYAQVLVVCLACIFLAINLPIMFRFGVEKGRIAFFLVVGVSVGVGVLVSGRIDSILETAGNNIILETLPLVPIFLAGTVLLNFLSVLVATKLYKKRFC